MTSTEEARHPRWNAQPGQNADVVPPPLVAAAGRDEKLTETGIYKHMTKWTASLVTNHAEEGGYLRVADNQIRKKGKQICVQLSPDTES